jgi:hypothetical protein
MRTIVSALILGLLSGTALAGDPAPTTPAPKASTTAGIPDSYSGIVAEMRTQATAADTALAANNVAKVRDAAKRLGELAGGVAGKSDGIAADSRTTVTAAATRIQQKAGEMLTASDKNDMPTAKTAFSAIKTDIETLAKYTK